MTTAPKALPIFALILSLSLSACKKNEAKPTASNEELNQHTAELQPLVEEALVWRQKSIAFLNYLKEKSERTALSSADLNKLYSGARAYMGMREKILAHALRYQNVVSPNIYVDYDSAEGALFMKQMKVSLAAALVLYDNYLLGVNPYYSEDKFRRLLSRDVPDLEGEIHLVAENYLNPEHRTKVAFGISHFIKEQESSGYKAIDREAAYLDAIILQSPSFSYFKENAYKGIARLTFEALFRRIGDDIDYIGRAFTFIGSSVFGNLIGLVEERKGMMLSLPEEEKRAIAGSLQPLDVLLEKTPFRLTDKLIPGHWGHVAIWVGNEAQLRELDLWDHPAVVAHQKAIQAGQHIVEALRPGVEINTLEHFLNIDDFVAIRREDLPREEARAALVRTFRQIGKDYDFNFDVETDERIVCSEIAYVVFTDLEWPISKQLGRFTISPDNVANKAVSRNPFAPVVMYHDGKRVNDRLDESLQLLLAEDYEGFEKLHPDFYSRGSIYKKRR